MRQGVARRQARRLWAVAGVAAILAAGFGVVVAPPASASGTSFYQYQDCATVGNEFPTAQGSVGNCIPIGAVPDTVGAIVAPGGTITLNFPGQLPCEGVGTSCGSGGQIGIGEITPPPGSQIGGGFFATIVSGCSYGDTSCTIQVPSSGTPVPPDAAKLQLQACLQGVSGGTCGSAGGEIAFDYFFVGTGTPPTAAFTDQGDANPAFNGLDEDFDASSSSSTAGPIVSYAWNFGDGDQGSGVTPEHTYAAAGTYAVTLAVTDSQGNSSTVVHNVTVPNLVITTTSLPDGAVGSTYGSGPGFTLGGAGGTPPYHWALTGGTPLPNGLSLSGALISGTPTQAGQTTVTIQVSDSSPTPLQATKTFTLTVTSQLIVDSTGDGPDNNPGDGRCDTGSTVANGDPECTLRAAMQEANADGGGTITFNLAGGADIAPQSPLPTLSGGITIDGTGVQPLLSGATVAAPLAVGITLQGASDVLKGLAVEGFGTAQVEVDGMGDQIANLAFGCLPESDYPGGATFYPCTAIAPVAHGGPVGISITGTSDQIGPNVTSVAEVGPDIGVPSDGMNADIAITAPASQDAVGGDTLTGNVTVGAGADTNTIGGLVNGTPDPVFTANVTVTGDNNLIQDSNVAHVELDGSNNTFGGTATPQDLGNIVGSARVVGANNTVQGNQFTGSEPNGTLGSGLHSDELEVENSAIVLDNVFAASEVSGIDAITVEAGEAQIVGNSITGSTGSGVVVAGFASNVRVSDNIITRSHASGVDVVSADNGFSPTGVEITGNSIFDDTGLGIDLGGTGVPLQNNGDPGILFSGPNVLQTYPVFAGITTPQPGQVEVTGLLQSAGSQTYIIEVFANAACNSSGFGEGQTSLGTFTVQTSSALTGGLASFDQTLDVPPDAGQYITATATDPSGNTSEFSKCRPIGFATPFTAASGSQGAGSPAGLATTQGSNVTFTASGYGAGETADATLHSTPIDLGSFTADSNGDVHGVVKIPASTTVGFHDLILAGLTSGVTGDLPLSILAASSSAPEFTADSPPLTATAASVYTYTFAASGDPGPTYALGTGPPSWLSISSTSGAVSGTPPAGTTSFAYTVTAANGVSPDATAGPFTVIVRGAPTAPSFTADSPPVTATAGSAYTYTFAATGTPAPTFALLAGGPSWLSIDATSGVVSGTAPAGTTTFAFGIRATNGISPDATAGPFTVTVSSWTGTARANIDLDATAHDIKPGNTVTLRVTISGRIHKPKPTGTVSFTDDGAAVPACTDRLLPASGKVTCKLSYSTTIGSPHRIVASYSGDLTYGPTMAATTVRVTKIRSRLRLDASRSPVIVGQQLTYRATIVADEDNASPVPKGTVTFTDDGVAIPGCTSVIVNPGGPTTCAARVTTGTHHIKAVYSGDDAYEGSSAALTETVTAGRGEVPR